MAKKKATKKVTRKASSDHTVREQKVTKEIRFQLNPDEKNKMADSAAKLSKERDQDVETLKEHNKIVKSKIKSTQQEIDRLLDCHIKGFEDREVECIERMDWNAKVVEYLINDEIVDARDMTDSELQMVMDTNSTKTIAKRDNRTKAEKNPEANLTPEELANRDIADVHDMESHKRTKRSALDGASANL